MVGGVTAIIGAKFVGPRIGKYDKNGNAKIIPGHNVVLAALGVFILWFSWFGFNGASTLEASDGDSLSLIGLILLNTNLSAAAATLVAMGISWIKLGKPDVGITMNGALAGLVGITAGCAVVEPIGAVGIGVLSSASMIAALDFVETKLKIDDPVGAFAVHGVAGGLGTILVGVFAQEGGVLYGGGLGLLGIQILGVLAVILWVTVSMVLVFKLIQSTIGLRVSVEEEEAGMDVSEHGLANSYADFASTESIPNKG